MPTTAAQAHGHDPYGARVSEAAVHAKGLKMHINGGLNGELRRGITPPLPYRTVQTATRHRGMLSVAHVKC